MLGALSDFPEYQYTDHVHDFEVKDVSPPTPACACGHVLLCRHLVQGHYRRRPRWEMP